MVSKILATNKISNIDKLVKLVHSDSFGEESSLLLLRKLMIAGSSLWWRYVIRMANHPLHPFPYPQPIISTPIAYWQALSMHRLQNTISQKQFPYNKESTPLMLGSNTDHCSWSSTLYQTANHLLSKLIYHRYVLISFPPFFGFKPQQQP